MNTLLCPTSALNFPDGHWFQERPGAFLTTPAFLIQIFQLPLHSKARRVRHAACTYARLPELVLRPLASPFPGVPLCEHGPSYKQFYRQSAGQSLVRDAEA